MSGEAPNGSPKGEKKGGGKILVKVAGVVVATGIAWGLYKTFSRPDHPEKRLETDAALAPSNSWKGAVEDRFREANGNRVVQWVQQEEEEEEGAQAKKPMEGIQVMVREGDTLWSLAWKYGASVHSIREVNGIESGDSVDPLNAGDILTIPRPAP